MKVALLGRLTLCNNYNLYCCEVELPSLRLHMGRVRTKTVKRASRLIIEKYYTKLSFDFHTNKRVCEEIAIIPTKRLRNKIAGFVTHLMKRIQKGPVRGISIKLQEEERERRDNFQPETSALYSDESKMIDIDVETKKMLTKLGLEIPNTLVNPIPGYGAR